jgi:DNA-binding NtrC family response regulator
MRVLVVDDEPLIRWSLAEALRRQGCLVVEAGDARGAVDRLTAPGAPFDVVLLDYRLPDSNDLGLLSRIRDGWPGCPIILMTAFGSAEVLDGARRLGAVAIVQKPFDLNDVTALAWQAHHSRPL